MTAKTFDEWKLGNPKDWGYLNDYHSAHRGWIASREYPVEKIKEALISMRLCKPENTYDLLFKLLKDLES
jgi:hypothetical protein